MGFKAARLRAGKKVTDVMEYLGVSDGAVYMWETGLTFPTVEKLKKLADFYGCSTDELLREDNNDGTED